MDFYIKTLDFLERVMNGVMAIDPGQQPFISQDLEELNEIRNSLLKASRQAERSNEIRNSLLKASRQANEKMDLIKHMALLRNVANDVTEIMSSTAAADFINAAIEIINDYPSDGKLVDTGTKSLHIQRVGNSCCDNPELDKGMQLGFGKKLCKNCGGHIAI